MLSENYSWKCELCSLSTTHGKVSNESDAYWVLLMEMRVMLTGNYLYHTNTMSNTQWVLLMKKRVMLIIYKIVFNIKDEQCTWNMNFIAST